MRGSKIGAGRVAGLERVNPRFQGSGAIGPRPVLPPPTALETIGADDLGSRREDALGDDMRLAGTTAVILHSPFLNPLIIPSSSYGAQEACRKRRPGRGCLAAVAQKLPRQPAGVVGFGACQCQHSTGLVLSLTSNADNVSRLPRMLSSSSRTASLLLLAPLTTRTSPPSRSSWDGPACRASAGSRLWLERTD